MRFYFIILFLLIGNIYSFAFSSNLSNSAEISVITCSPGTELYSIYGHSAIRVKDSISNTDVVFNYGTFDFNTPNFYLKFLNGNLKYMLSASKFNSFMRTYFHENRSVYEQQLNLDSSQKQRLFNLLLENYQPENKYYRYDFFFDNCATRIRDIVYKVIDGEIVYNGKTHDNRTFRSLIHEYLYNNVWIKDGQDLLIGLPSDEITKVQEQMFLPDYLMYYFSISQYIKDGKTTPLVKSKHTLYEFQPSKCNRNPQNPAKVVWGLFMLFSVITLLNIKFKASMALFIFDRLLLFIIGLAGILILFLSFFTLHEATQNNLNLLWSFPSILIFVFVPYRKFSSSFFQNLIIAHLMGILAFIALYLFKVQDIPQMTLPLCLILLQRLLIFSNPAKKLITNHLIKKV